MEIPATSYLRVAGASIVDGSGTPVRLGWVVGFNLLNEPADEEGYRLIAWYAETARRVRDIDPDRMLFLDGNRYSTDFSMFTEPLPNTVYTAHDYVTAGLSSKTSALPVGRAAPHPDLRSTHPRIAGQFRGVTPAEARELAGSFRWELCTRRTGLEETLRFEIAKG
jgi:hypothetical protein